MLSEAPCGLTPKCLFPPTLRTVVSQETGPALFGFESSISIPFVPDLLIHSLEAEESLEVVD